MQENRKKNSQLCRWLAVGKARLFCQQSPALPTAGLAVGKLTKSLPTAGRRQSPFPFFKIKNSRRSAIGKEISKKIRNSLPTARPR
jgi:hypothetical protein